MKKNKFAKYLFALLIGFISSYICLTPTIFAAEPDVNVSYFWGITVNFDSQSFESEVVLDDDGEWDERLHSFAHATGDDLGINQLRRGSQKMTNIKKYHLYNMHYVQLSKSSNGNIPNTWTKPTRGGKAVLADNPTINQTMKWTGDLDSSAFRNISCTKSLGAWGIDDAYNNCSARDVNAIYTWPGVKKGGDATAEDQAMLTWASGTLTKNYNDVIAFILNGASVNNLRMSTDKDRNIFLDLAAQIAYAPHNHTTYTYDVDKKLSVTYKTSTPTAKEIEKLDTSEPGTLADCPGSDPKNPGASCEFIKYTLQGGNGKNSSIIVRYKVPKGYADGQRLEGYVQGRTNKSSDKIKHVSKRLTFQHIFYQATFNYYMAGQTSRSANKFYEAHAEGAEAIISGILDSALKGLQRMLGMYSFEELMLNEGSRNLKYWNGVVPASWFNASQYFYLFTFSLSMLILLIALVKLAFEKSLSTVGNVARKVSLMEGIKKTIICAVLVVLFQSIFYIVCQVNSSLVLALSGLTEGDAILNLSQMAGGTLGSVIIAMVFFYIMLKMNFTYMLRGITVLICYLLGPICIMLSAMGDKYNMITSSWIKELLGNIFIQTIHAMMLMLYINISRYGANSSIEKIVLVYSFVPITEFVRTKLFALGKGIDDVASNMAQTTGAIAAGIGVGGAKASLGIAKGGVKLGSAGLNKISHGKVGSPFSSGGGGAGGLSPGRVGAAVGANVTAGQKFRAGMKAIGTSSLRTMGAGIGAGAQLAMGFASGAANEQGRADGFQLHRGISDLERAAENTGFMDDYNSNLATASAHNDARESMRNAQPIKDGYNDDTGILDTKNYEKETGVQITNLGGGQIQETMHFDKDSDIAKQINNIGYNKKTRAKLEQMGFNKLASDGDGGFFGSRISNYTQKGMDVSNAGNKGRNLKISCENKEYVKEHLNSISGSFTGQLTNALNTIEASNLRAQSSQNSQRSSGSSYF